MNWIDFYSEHFEIYLEEFAEREADAKITSNEIHSYISEKYPNAKKILDIPCGSGRLCIPLARYDYQLLGIDSSKGFIDYGKKLVNNLKSGNNVKFQLEDMYKASKTVKTFDPDVIVNWWTSIGYISEKKDAEFLKILSLNSHKGTVLMLETWHRHNVMSFPIKRTWVKLGKYISLIEREMDPLDKWVTSIHEYFLKNGQTLELVATLKSRIRLYEVSEIANLLTAAGWEVKEVFNNLSSRVKFDPNIDRVVFIAESV